MTLEQAENYILFLGELCDSPISLRTHIAIACQDIKQKRQKSKKGYETHGKERWIAWLPKASSTTNR